MSSRISGAIRGTAWLAVITGITGGCLAGYRIWDPMAGHRQAALQGQLRKAWATTPATRPAAHTSACATIPGTLRPAEPFAIMTIPRLSPAWRFAIVQGTALAQLATGPGHITATSMPGGRNFAVAAHDITAGNAFLHLGSLRPGDLIRVRTAHCLYTYQINRPPYKVRYTNTAVLREAPGQRRITLITCWPVTLAFTPWRIIADGTLLSEQPR
jgi:LPXTG-site transpeptidase (sortase) family protein